MGDGSERREHLRIPVEMWARTYDQADFTACEGDISMGGARVKLPSAPKDNQIEVLVQLPGESEPTRLQGEIISTSPAEGGKGVMARVKFVEQEFLDELKLAKLMDNVTGEWELWTPEKKD